MSVAFLNKSGIRHLTEYCNKHGKVAHQQITDNPAEHMREMGISFSGEQEGYDRAVSEYADYITKSAISIVGTKLKHTSPPSTILTERDYISKVSVIVGGLLEQYKGNSLSSIQPSEVVDAVNTEAFYDKVSQKLEQDLAKTLSNQFNRAYQLQQQQNPIQR